MKSESAGADTPAQTIDPCALAKFDWLSMVCTARALPSGHD